MSFSMREIEAMASHVPHLGDWCVSQVAFDVYRAEIGGFSVDSTSAEEAFAIALAARQGTLSGLVHSVTRSGHSVYRRA